MGFSESNCPVDDRFPLTVTGFFPGWMTGPVQAEYNYNVAEDVEGRLR